MRKKFFVRVLIAILCCLVGFYVNFNICIRYDEGFNALTMVTIAGVAAILEGIAPFLTDDVTKVDVVEGLISFGLAIAILACGYTSNLTASFYLIPVFFIACAICNSLFYAGAAKGSKKNGRTLAMWGYISLVMANFALLFSVCPIFLILAQNTNEDLDVALKFIPMILIGVFAFLALLLIVLHLVKNRPIANESYSSGRSRNSSTRSYSENRSGGDYRGRAVGVFYNVLRDRCRSIAGEFSSSYGLTHGRARFSVSVSVGSSDITYTIDINVTVNAQNQYEMNDLQSSLKSELETVSQKIYYKTETLIDQLRDKYQDFDGEYSINVRVGNVR